MGLFSKNRGTSTTQGSGTQRTNPQITPMSQEDIQTSLQSVAEGGIPLTAKKRLEGQTGSDRPFTSTLSTSEFLALSSVGLVPISQVMGSSVYQIGYQPLPLGFSQGMAMGSLIQPQLLSVQTEALNRCRDLALSRLADEARAVGADGVLAVKITSGSVDFGTNVISTSISGTAFRYPDSLKPKSKSYGLGLTNLSGAEVVQLVSHGYLPVGLLASVVVYFAPIPYLPLGSPAGPSIFGGGGSWGGNFEISSLSQALRYTQHVVRSSVKEQAERVGADGIVGMDLTTGSAPIGEESTRAVYFTSSVYATAIKRAPSPVDAKPVDISLDLGT
ncbi:MAG: heavy metal-binding domain-containing protein [Acidimicrobiaceae bacterium]|nr:heavy metal-binding domain-containing protein [Acidimicrobiaceae bacterium]